SAETLRTQYENKGVANLFQKNFDQSKEIEKLNADVMSWQDKYQSTHGKLQKELATSSNLQTIISSLRAEADASRSSEKRAVDALSALQAKRDNLKAEKEDELRDGLTKAQSRSERLSRDIRVSEEREQNLRVAYQKRIMELHRVNGGLQQVIDKWQKETGRQEAIKTEQYDGKIIQVDIDNKFVVIDLGRAQKVRRGMRFDIIRWRLNDWSLMGSIEITEVGETTSNGVILDAIVQKKVCPLTGYVAKSPEEKYSPFAAGGPGQNQVVELVKVDVEEKPSMNPMDPIIIGDYITNPFYSKDRELKFAVAGESIGDKHSVNEIKQLITNYGGIVQDKVDVDTDYLVLGRILDEGSVAESEEAKKRRDATIKARDMATQYGIPIMREIELLNFIRK
ncbi:MAG: hypothetical protein JXR97_14585, partial [Planctomycetes bacterium]|nr:hypothetical protein [Planctomycetota bacterium]